MKALCETCLKYPICKPKKEIFCPDICDWLLKDNCMGDEERVKRINHFEKFYGKELSIISRAIIKFKKQKDQFSCSIIKNY